MKQKIKYFQNSPKGYTWFFHWGLIAFGYNKSEMNWGNGHVTVFKSYHLLFWHLRITQAFLKVEI